MTNTLVTASFMELHQDARWSTADFLVAAKDNIDGVFGEGYAKDNPELVAAFMIAASRNEAESCSSKVFDHCMEELRSSVDLVATSLSE